ncbi:MAG TPA: adenylate kinase [Limnochordia bacterium]
MRLVLMGLPGAGKGTQGERLQASFGIPHISSGAMFRQAITSHSEVGRRARTFIERGQLVPDDLTIAIVRERLAAGDCRAGFVLDGFPRTVPQAEALDAMLPQLGMALDAAINIRITEAEAIRRIARRRVCAQCGATYGAIDQQGLTACRECGGPLVQRPDDNEQTARDRLRVYMAQTHPLVAYYAARGLLSSVDGQQSIEAVFDDIRLVLEERKLLSHSSEVGG